MLKLVDIKKNYEMSDETVHALKGVSVNFRRNEFVAILGASGCGKTTLLNIVGGLDRYSSGDLIIEGKSTKSYKAVDWDTYRNHSIGFIFQSYNLIGHINILKNVELALTISGINKKERKERALKALEMVGLKGQGKKRPNQLSGGQMQRVAIARALINNPEIVLADEPTGALDSETSVQIMELLKEVAKDRLVIMVTHNPELAKQYATRIIRMKDGEFDSDSMPYEGESEHEREMARVKKEQEENKGNKKHSAMSFLTALTLSFNNLMTKKGRTFLISFAGSIGIIGIALILSLSYGFNNYITEVQENSMSTYPLTVYDSQNNINFMELMMTGSNKEHELEKYPSEETIHEDYSMTQMLSQALSVKKTDTGSFKKYLETPEVAAKFAKYASDIQYDYSQQINVFAVNDLQGNPIDHPVKLSPIGFGATDTYIYEANTYRTESGEPLPKGSKKEELYNSLFYGDWGAGSVANAINMVGGNPFQTLLDDEELLENQFDVLKGHFPQAVNEVVIRVNKYNEIPDVFLYGIGAKDISYMMSNYIYSQIYTTPMGPMFEKPCPHEKIPTYSSTFDQVMGMEFALINNAQLYKKVEAPGTQLGYKYKGFYQGRTPNDDIMDVLENAFKLKVVGIVRPKKSSNVTSFSTAIGYHPDLYEYLFTQNENPTDLPFTKSPVLKETIANPDIDMLTGNPYIKDGDDKNTYEKNLSKFGYVDFENPNAIHIYPRDFAAKDQINLLIREYNDSLKPGQEDRYIQIIDNVGSMLTSVQTIIDAITYVLVAFVSISLLVSSIMIGIITYVSVLERTKEIGVLRSIGARKKDISRVFNAETLIIGLVAGILGIAVASLINIPIMLIINALTDIGLLIIVPWYGAVFLPLISVALTIIAGLIPASIASKRDPVIALRTE